jgi:hypothetical protein
MADPQQVEPIRQETAAWNRWRTDDDIIQPDPRGAHLPRGGPLQGGPQQGGALSTASVDPGKQIA